MWFYGPIYKIQILGRSINFVQCKIRYNQNLQQSLVLIVLNLTYSTITRCLSGKDYILQLTSRIPINTSNFFSKTRVKLSNLNVFIAESDAELGRLLIKIENQYLLPKFLELLIGAILSIAKNPFNFMTNKYKTKIII